MTHTHQAGKGEPAERVIVVEFPFQQNRFCLSHNIHSLMRIHQGAQLKIYFHTLSLKVKIPAITVIMAHN
jgi:peroxiredoxin